MISSHFYSPIVAPNNWWSSEGGFFGRYSMLGDEILKGGLSSESERCSFRTEQEANGVEQLLNLQPRAKVLDCACGYGRHSIELAKRGYNVVGVDINKEHLAAANRKARALGNSVNVHFEERDMREIRIKSAFDAIINMGYSFGFFDEDAENFRVLTGWRDALKVGGKLLIHIDANVPRITAGNYRLRETRARGAHLRLHIRESYSHRTRRIYGTWELEENAKATLLTPYSMRVFTAEEMCEWLFEAGFANVDIFASWSRASYTKNAAEMMLVATK